MNSKKIVQTSEFVRSDSWRGESTMTFHATPGLFAADISMARRLENFVQKDFFDVIIDIFEVFFFQGVGHTK